MPDTQQLQPFQPTEFGSRNTNVLTRLLGREGTPNLPQVNQVPISDLLQELRLASEDEVRRRNIRDIVERRSEGLTSAEPARPQQRQLVPGEANSFNPFQSINQVLGGQ